MIWELFKYLFIETFGLVIASVAGIVFVGTVLYKTYSKKVGTILFLIFVLSFVFLFVPNGLPNATEYPFNLTTFGPKESPGIPLKNVFTFFRQLDKFPRLDEIAAQPTDIPGPIDRDESALVEIEMTAVEVIAQMADGVIMNYWTYDRQVPGPLLRVREGDTVRFTLHNDPNNLHSHDIDLHAVTGPGGGAAVTNVAPGESATFEFKALNPGAFVYHCANRNVATHMSHGMYGLIVVEPEGGLPEVDKEFYVMQGEFYTTGELGRKGLQVFDAQKMLDGDPEYIVFNGRVGALNENNMQANVGETVRMFVGNGGVNLVSSFHVIGEIFDRVYPEAAIGGDGDGGFHVHENVQTTMVPAGGASIVEFGLEVPGKNILVDHALARLDRGGWGVLKVNGPENPEIFQSIE